MFDQPMMSTAATGSASFPIHSFRTLRFPNGPSCPRCEDHRIQRWGRFGWRQRYRCKGCHRTFSDFTGTPLAYVKRVDRWPVFCRLFPRALTVRRMAVLLDVHPETSFRWRHRLLDSLRLTEAPALSARVSVDLGWLPYSTKGERDPQRAGSRLKASARLPRRTAWLILACDPTGASFARFAGEVCPGWLRIRKVLAGRIRPGAVLLYRTNRKLRVAPAAAALGLSSEHEGAAPEDEERRDPEPARFHLVRYRRWELRFRGIASRYLDNYLVWFRLVELARHVVRPQRRLEPILCGSFPPRQSG
jgi:transposase-like protein